MLSSRILNACFLCHRRKHWSRCFYWLMFRDQWTSFFRHAEALDLWAKRCRPMSVTCCYSTIMIFLTLEEENARWKLSTYRWPVSRVFPYLICKLWKRTVNGSLIPMWPSAFCRSLPHCCSVNRISVMFPGIVMKNTAKKRYGGTSESSCWTLFSGPRCQRTQTHTTRSTGPRWIWWLTTSLWCLCSGG